jgi:ribosomal protein L7Ae-like RNA K-turn-binding protein
MKIEKIRGLLGLARRARTVTVGSRETRKAMRRGEIRLVLLASDGSERDRERLVRLTNESRVPHRTVGTREELGSWVGGGPVSVLGLRDPNLAAAVRADVDAGAAECRGEST